MKRAVSPLFTRGVEICRDKQVVTPALEGTPAFPNQEIQFLRLGFTGQRRSTASGNPACPAPSAAIGVPQAAGHTTLKILVAAVRLPILLPSFRVRWK